MHHRIPEAGTRHTQEHFLAITQTVVSPSQAGVQRLLPEKPLDTRFRWEDKGKASGG
jgi:hypothetical protein